MLTKLKLIGDAAPAEEVPVTDLDDWEEQ